jgi:DNA-binding LytR/AlgR family response regulator
MSIKCVAVEDEPFALEKIKAFISRLPQLDLLQSFRSARPAIEFIRETPVELIFLDIQMDDITGIEMVEQLVTKPQFIFTTAYNDYAIRAFELAATDYLLKPYTFERFCQAVNKAAEYIQWQNSAMISSKSETGYMFLKSGYKLVKVMTDEILYIEGMRDFQSIVTKENKVLVSSTFQELEKMLPKSFIRCHKSFIVAASKIESIENDRIKIAGKLIPVGDSYKESFYNQL